MRRPLSKAQVLGIALPYYGFKVSIGIITDFQTPTILIVSIIVANFCTEKKEINT